MKYLISLFAVCVPVVHSAPTSNAPRSPEPFTSNVKRAATAQPIDSVYILDDDVQPFEIVNIDEHTADTLPSNITPVQIIPAQDSAEVFEGHDLDGVSLDDIPDDLSVFEAVDIYRNTVDTLPDGVFPVHNTPIGTAAGASAISANGSAVFASATSGLNAPDGVIRTGMSRVQVVPSSHVISRVVHPVDGRSAKYIGPTVTGPSNRKVKCRQADQFPFKGPNEGLFKFYSNLVREEMSDCTLVGVVL